MIKNDKQYNVIKKKLQAFIVTLEKLKEEYKEESDMNTAHIDAIQSEIDVLSDELTEYDSLKSGNVKDVILNSIFNLSDLLIKSRIILGWSQAELANKLCINEQQIQRYEASDYESASLSRIYDVIDVLGVSFQPIKARVKEIKYNIPEHIDPDLLKECQRKINCDKKLFAIEN